VTEFPINMASPGEARSPQNYRRWRSRSRRGPRPRGAGQAVSGDPSRWAACRWLPRRTWASTTCGICPPFGTGGCGRRSGQRWRSPPPRARRSTGAGTPRSAPPRGSSRP